MGLAIWGGCIAELRGSTLRGWAQTSCEWKAAVPRSPGARKQRVGGGGRRKPLQSPEGKGS